MRRSQETDRQLKHSLNMTLLSKCEFRVPGVVLTWPNAMTHEGQSAMMAISTSNQTKSLSDSRKGRPLHIASLPSHSYRTPCTPASSLAWPVPSRCLPPACAVIPHHHLPRSHADIADGAAAWPPARRFSLVRSYARDLKLSLLHSSLFVGRMEPCLISGVGTNIGQHLGP